MNNKILDLVRRYSVKYDRQIAQICSPLKTNLNIPYFFYYFFDKDGRCAILSNDIEYTQFYYIHNMHLNNPWYVHPKFLRSGYALNPSTFQDDRKILAQDKYAMDQVFLVLQATENNAEGFVYYDRQLDFKGLPHYVENLDLLMKFNSYFKREAVSLIGKVLAEGFNMREEQQDSFLINDSSFSLSNKNPKKQMFLKEIYQLSPQEERCLEFYRQGYSARATAAIMEISNRTIEGYFENIKRKLNCYCKSELLTI